MIGKRVDYRGSLDDCWGRYQVAEEVWTPDGPRYHLAAYAGDIAALRNVRRESFTLVPGGPKHRVVSRELRAQIVQGEMARKYTRQEWLPYVWDAIDSLPRRLAELIERNRPVEAEVALLNGEVFVGCISHDDFQRRVTALVVAGDDESWTPRSQLADPSAAAAAGDRTRPGEADPGRRATAAAVVPDDDQAAPEYPAPPDGQRWSWEAVGGRRLEDGSDGARGCAYLIATSTPRAETCGKPVVGKWHAEDDEWFCAAHMGDPAAAAQLSICPRCFAHADYRNPVCGQCGCALTGPEADRCEWVGGTFQRCAERAEWVNEADDGDRFGYCSHHARLAGRQPHAEGVLRRIDTNGTTTGGTTMTAPTATTEVTGVYSLRHYYLGAQRDLITAQDTLGAVVQQVQRMARVADQAIGQLSSDKFGPGTLSAASNVLDAVSTAAARLTEAQAAVDAAKGAAHQATQQLHVHRGLEEATAGAGAEAPAGVRRTHGQD